MYFNGVGNGPNGYDPKKVNKFGYTNGYGNGQYSFFSAGYNR